MNIKDEVVSLGSTSKEVYEIARQVSPRGVHGGRRYYPPSPIFFDRYQDQYLWDIEGRRFLDLHGAFGTAALGHNSAVVRATVVEMLEEHGVLFGAAHPWEVALSKRLVASIPCAEMVALCGGGGSDPLYIGTRLARAVTGRQRILKFEGGYHGWHDPLAVSAFPRLKEAGPRASPHAVPMSAGADECAHKTIVGILNDPSHLEVLFRQSGDELACAVVEPVCHSAGCISLSAEFLETLRNLCTEYGTLLMFDEIMTGFRHGLGGAQELVGVTPDLAAVGKAMGNGYPISALVGQHQYMSRLAPSGDALYSGTHCGGLIGVAAAIATIDEMATRNVHDHLFALGDRFRSQINNWIEEEGIPAVCQGVGSISCLYFGLRSVREYRDYARIHDEQYFPLNEGLRERLLTAGIYLQPYSTNRMFFSDAHSDADIDRVVEVAVEFMKDNRLEIERLGSK